MDEDSASMTIATPSDPIRAIEDEILLPLAAIEAQYVARVLESTNGNIQRAARILRVDPKTLRRMIKRHNIERYNSGTSRSRAA
ncbi:MAG TPA: helix-turn-helix domain-containing protein [Pyrinomonadaceae bacterium]|nr:helix-turn-helix domain-containing protein [Pyrinomonadaceae bacterium]